MGVDVITRNFRSVKCLLCSLTYIDFHLFLFYLIFLAFAKGRSNLNNQKYFISTKIAKNSFVLVSNLNLITVNYLIQHHWQKV